MKNAELFKISELSYLEIALNYKDNFRTELICGTGYATLANIYFKQGNDDTLPLILGYIRLSQGATHIIDEQMDKNSFFDKTIKTLEYISYMLLRKKEWDNKFILIDLETFPTISQNEKSIQFYEDTIPNLRKEDIARFRENMENNGLF